MAGGPPRRSPLRRPLGGRRRLVLARARLAVVKDVAHAHQATVNDVLLAAVAGGLHSLLARGVPVAGLSLRASVPVALRAQAAAAALGNQVGLMVVPLPVTEPDPVRRLRRIAQATIDRAPGVLAGLRPVGSLTVLRALNRYSRHQHLVDLFVTNVPGPQVPLFVVGARLLEAFPVVQVAGNVPLSVAALSYDGQLNLGVQSDPVALPDVDTFAPACAGRSRSWPRPRRRSSPADQPARLAEASDLLPHPPPTPHHAHHAELGGEPPRGSVGARSL